MPVAEILAIIGGVLGPIGGVAALHVNRLRERDKLEFDKQMLIFAERVAHCESDCKEKKEALTSERARRENAELKVARLEAENASLEREMIELREENKKLQERVLRSKR